MLTGIKNVAPEHRRRLVRSRVFTKKIVLQVLLGAKDLLVVQFQMFLTIHGD